MEISKVQEMRLSRIRESKVVVKSDMAVQLAVNDSNLFCNNICIPFESCHRLHGLDLFVQCLKPRFFDTFIFVYMSQCFSRNNFAMPWPQLVRLWPFPGIEQQPNYSL
ncbi:unnamed protein product [Umbelopsis ramanniana]